ncbi:trichohyalin-like [Leptopilina heterotoma]|uniref:trichohyalin-like n=1 Tax=Leptopilina heterotoma TaxID=63436 RepID=UPI001CA8DD7D|nr:trichohyalin-like [Leptopilina heterotoma]
MSLLEAKCGFIGGMGNVVHHSPHTRSTREYSWTPFARRRKRRRAHDNDNCFSTHMHIHSILVITTISGLQNLDITTEGGILLHVLFKHMNLSVINRTKRQIRVKNFVNSQRGEKARDGILADNRETQRVLSSCPIADGEPEARVYCSVIRDDTVNNRFSIVPRREFKSKAFQRERLEESAIERRLHFLKRDCAVEERSITTAIERRRSLSAAERQLFKSAAKKSTSKSRGERKGLFEKCSRKKSIQKWSKKIILQKCDGRKNIQKVEQQKEDPKVQQKEEHLKVQQKEKHPKVQQKDKRSEVLQQKEHPKVKQQKDYPKQKEDHLKVQLKEENPKKKPNKEKQKEVDKRSKVQLRIEAEKIKEEEKEFKNKLKRSCNKNLLILVLTEHSKVEEY